MVGPKVHIIYYFKNIYYIILQYYLYILNSNLVLKNTVFLPKTFCVHVILNPIGTTTLNPSKFSARIPLLVTNVESMKLWVAPLSIRTVTRYPFNTPLTLKELNLGVPDKMAITPLFISSSSELLCSLL